MKVLITGGAGFIGSNLCKRFLDEEYKVICFDNLGSGTYDNIVEFEGNPNFKFINGDVSKKEEIEKIEKVDLILHFASRASPNDYQANSFDTMRANTLGTFYLLQKAQKDKARMVFASTSEIYGQAQVFPTPETYWGYVNSFGPRSCYDESKRFGETICYEFLTKFNVDIRIVRIFNTYGPKMKYNDGRVITNFVYQALNNKPITVYGDGSQTRCFCYIDDLVEGIYRLATREGLKGEIINLGNNEEKTIMEVAKLVISAVGSKSEIVFNPLPIDDPVRRVPDLTKAKKLLDWEPKTPLKVGIKKVIDWFRSNI